MLFGGYGCVILEGMAVLFWGDKGGSPIINPRRASQRGLQ